MNHALTTRCVSSPDEWLGLRDDWQRLHDAMPHNLVFNGWEWNRLWWQHYGGGKTLQLLVVRDNNRVVGLLPAYLDSTRMHRLFSVSTLRLLGDGGDTSADGLTLLAEPRLEQRVVATILDWLSTDAVAERLWFRSIPADSELAVALRLLVGRVEEQSRPVASLPHHAAEWRQQISRNTHKQMKRRRNRLATAGNWRFYRCTTAAEVANAFDRLVDLHHLRRSAKGGSDSFSSAAYVEFHRTLVEKLLVRDQLWLMVLELDGCIIGVEYAFAEHATLAFFQTGFDPNFEMLAPGHLMMSMTIEAAIGAGLRRIDLLRGDYAYKSSYATGTAMMLNVDLWLKRPTGVAFGLIDGLRKIFNRN